MDKSDMIEALLSAFHGSATARDARRCRLQRMSVAGLKREMLLRGLAAYDDLEGDGFEDDSGDGWVHAAFLGLVRDPLYAD